MSRLNNHFGLPQVAKGKVYAKENEDFKYSLLRPSNLNIEILLEEAKQLID